MANTIPIQTSFAGGELSPKLRGRVDTELYKKGLGYCENFEPLAHGPVLMRGGTRFTALFADLTSDARVFSFPRQGDVGFLLVMGGNKLRVRDGKFGAAVTGGTAWLKNPSFTYAWQYWDRDEDLDWLTALWYPLGATFVADGRYCLGGAGFPGTSGFQPWIRQETQTIPAGTYTLRLDYSTADGNSLDVLVGTTSGAHDILEEVAASTASLSDYRPVEFSVVLAAPTVLFVQLQTKTINVENVGTQPPPGSNSLAIAAGAELREVSLRSVGVTDKVWDLNTTPAMPWSDVRLEKLQMVAEPARDRVMFFHPEVAPYELLFDAATESWTFSQINFTHVTPAPWNAGDHVGCFPGAAELYQGRLIVGGIKGKENTILASKSGEPYDFTEATAASNADYFSLDVSTKGAIRWMQGHRTLLMGTDKGEFILTAQGGVLTPSDFEVRAQSGYGSAAVQAIHLGELVLYVSRDRRRLRMLSYNLQENGWQTRDLTFTSEHLTGGQVREVHWLSAGNDSVVAVMRSGAVMCWTFNKPENVVAPWRATFGNNVYSMAICDVGDNDRIWMLIQRYGGVALEEWHVADDPGRIHLDGYVSREPDNAIEGGACFVDGLSHLEGRSVVSIVDGIVQDAKTVTSGSITLPTTGTNAVVGLFGTHAFTTLRHEGGNPAGTTQGAKQRPVKLSLRLNDSALPLVNGVRCGADRTPATPMDTMEGRVTLDATVRVLGWEDGAEVTISQDVPIRTEVLALYAIVATREV